MSDTAEPTPGISGKRFRLLVEQLPLSLQIFDPAGRTVRVNRAWEKLWGLTLEQLGDYNILEDQQLVEKGIMPYIRRAWAGEVVEIPPVPYVPDRGEHAGREQWTRAIIYPALNEDGTLSEVVLLHEDITRRRQAENRLAEQARLLDLSYEPIFVRDVADRITYWNRGAVETYGFTEEEALGRKAAELLQTEFPETPAVISEKLRRDGRWQGELRQRRKDGRTIMVASRWALDRGAVGEPASILETNSDITERKDAENRLAFQKHLLEALTESVLDGILIVSPEGRMIHFNQQFLAIWNFPPEVLASQSDEAALQWAAQQTADPQKFLARVAAVYQQPDEPVREELVMKDGRVYERFGSPIQSGTTRLGWVWTFRDVTESRRAGIELREKEAFVRLLLDSAADAFYGVDREGTTTFCNAAFLRMLGFEREDEVIGRRLHDVIHHSHPDGAAYPVHECPIYRTAQTGRPAHRDDEFLFRRDGSSFPVEYWAYPILHAGELRGAVTTFIDITERREAESALRRAKQQAEEANRAKDEFLAMLSHELRTPLTPVLMATAALRNNPQLSDEVRADLEMIERNIELETLLIDDLLDLTRIAHGKYELNREAVDVHTSIAEAIAISRREIDAKPLRLIEQLDAREHQCWADGARLQQVFWNIIKNAVKFSPAGGELRIRTRNDDAHHLLIDFTDTGIGIEPELQPKIFDAFEQGGRRVHARHGGLGLGLAISKRVIDMLGGEISVQSAGANSGTTFSIKLQAMETSLLEGPEYPLAAPVAAANGASILLVEDHLDTARILQRMLERTGYRVAHATDIAGATSLLNGCEFDLIISDLGLPDGSALEFMREVRRAHTTPAIAISGFGMPTDVVASQSAGFSEHLTKPVNWQRLHNAVQRLTSAGKNDGEAPRRD